MHYFNQTFTEENRHWRIQMSKNLSFWRLWYFCIIKRERVSSPPYMIWLLHWWNYLSWNKLICLSGTEDTLITHLSKVPDYVWRNWQLIITHESRRRFESLQKKIDETQSKLGTVIQSKSWWEKAYVKVMKKILRLDLYNHKSSHKLSFTRSAITLKLQIFPSQTVFNRQSDPTHAHIPVGLIWLHLMFKPTGCGRAVCRPLRPHTKCILSSVYLSVVSLSG